MIREPTSREVYTTPTAYTPEEAPRWLVTPFTMETRPYVLLLDPAKIDWIVGPLRISATRGIQYILPHGYPADAIFVPGAPTGAWILTVD